MCNKNMVTCSAIGIGAFCVYLLFNNYTNHKEVNVDAKLVKCKNNETKIIENSKLKESHKIWGVLGWEKYVEYALELGFIKVTIINRQNYETIGCTMYNSLCEVAITWHNDNKLINENQELLDDWLDINKNTFCFYGKKFNIIMRDNYTRPVDNKRDNNLLTFGYIRNCCNTQNLLYIPHDINGIILKYIDGINYWELDIYRMKCRYIVGVKGKEIIIGYKFRSIYFVVYGLKIIKNKGCDQRKEGFYGAQDAWNRISDEIFEPFWEYGV